MFDQLFAIIRGLFSKKKHLRLGFYGSPNAGKTTLANRIAKDLVGTEMGSASEVPHETRTIQKLENVMLQNNGRSLQFSLLDMPGISTKVDYREFMKFGMSKKDAQERAREATKGVIEAIKYLENVDAALLVVDSSMDPYTEVNLTILGNLEARKIPVMIIANKVDLPEADVKRIKDAFDDYKYPVVEVSALKGSNMDEVYKVLKERLG